MSEILYQPPKDRKKYLIISLAILFSLGAIIFLILAVKKENPISKKLNDSADGQEADKKVLSPEDIQEALTKKPEETGSSPNSAMNETQIDDVLKKEALPGAEPAGDEALEVAPQETKPLSPEEIQSSLNKRL